MEIPTSVNVTLVISYSLMDDHAWVSFFCDLMSYFLGGAYIEDNQLVIFDMKNISRGCVVRREKMSAQCSEFFLTPYNASKSFYSLQTVHLIMITEIKKRTINFK